MSQTLLFGTLPICSHAVYTFYIALFLVSLLIVATTTDLFRNKDKSMKKKWKRLVKRKQEERSEQFSILKETILTEFNNGEENENVGESKSKTDKLLLSQGLRSLDEILCLSFEDLVENLKSGKLSALKTLRAYQYKALQETEKFNCVTEFIPAAEEFATHLDELIKETGKSAGPLHGIPVCVKDDNDVIGMDTTLGCAQNLYKPAEANAAIVQCLVDLGAVPFCKTNVPQTVFTYGSHNPIFGETKNSLNPVLSPSGTSSGTASLIAAGGALFGVGSDIAGSLRVPAHNCGISTIKPTCGRISSRGIKYCLPVVGLDIVPGIMANNSQTVATVFRHLTENQNQHGQDVTCPSVSWNNEIFKSKKSLRLGYFTSLPLVPTIGDTPGRILAAKSALETAGHTLIPFQISDFSETQRSIITLCTADQGKTFRDLLKNEPEISPEIIETWTNMGSIPSWILRLIGYFLRLPWFPFHSHRISSLLLTRQITTPLELWAACEKRDEFKKQILGIMERDKLDAILSPTFAAPAVKIEHNLKLTLGNYAMLWNYVDFPAGVTRFGTESGEHLNSYDDEGDCILNLLKLAAESSIGMPIGVQVIGKPFEEEIVLRILCELDALYAGEHTQEKILNILQ